MSLILKSIDAATTTGVGAELFFDDPKSNFSSQLVTVGGPTVHMALEGTIDGATWVEISGSGLVADGIQPVSFGPLIGVRAKITSFSGGTSPSATVWVAAE